jgi:type VI secretion system protein ImpA
MNTQSTSIETLYQQQLGHPLDALLLPISEEFPCGHSLKSNGVYSAIQKARKADDASVPMGQWEHDLKTSDWHLVSKIASDAIANKSKDLQLGFWLLEAQIHQYGFSGIAPAISLLTHMCKSFWPDLHPQIIDNDIEYRTNLVHWANEKLQPCIRQLPITDSRNAEPNSWADWETAIQIEQLPKEQRSPPGQYTSSQIIINNIASTPIEFYYSVNQDIQLAIETLTQFSSLLDEYCGAFAPTLSGLIQLLREIDATLNAQNQHRSIMASSIQENPEITPEVTEDNPSRGSDNGGNRGPIKNRQQAYQQLTDAAEYLKYDDPHSPVPYLVFKAIGWGQLDTAALYQELFVDYQGQLNIFEILGLEIQKT